jgi:glycosyltransferase involved in cell wall biosynthesis
MNILFISIAWPPPAERNLYSDLMDEFVANGHRVFVVAATEYEIESGQQLNLENGIEVLRLKSGRIRKSSYIRKALSLLTLKRKIAHAIEMNIPGVRFDLIIGHTPPITLSSLFVNLKRKHKAQFYLLLKDIWPQGSVDHKVFRRFSIPWFYLRMHEVRIYKAADHIGCMSPLGVKYIITHNKFLKPEKVEVCPNSKRPTTEFYDLNLMDVREKYGIPKDSCVFVFSGNLGKGHGLDFLTDAIIKLADFPDAFFLIGGSGTHFQFLETMFKNYKGKNVFLYKWLPTEDFKMIMQTVDVGLILLNKHYSVPQFPARLLSYLDYSKPVLCAINKGTDIGSIIEESHCGKTLMHGDLETFIENIRFFCEHREERIIMGRNARRLLEKEYTTANGYEIIMKHFNYR